MLGLSIKQKRQELGITQSSLATMVQSSQNHISQIEGGKTPSLELFFSIANALGVTPNDLLGVSLPVPRDGPDCLSRCLAAWRECSEAVAALDPREIAVGLSAEARERIRTEAQEAREALDELLEAI